MANFLISGTTTAGTLITMTGDVTGSTVADSAGAYSFNIADSSTVLLTPTKAGYSFVPDVKSVTLSGAPATANFTGTRVGPLVDAAPLPSACYVDNGSAIATVPTALAGVPIPVNPGAQFQGQNVPTGVNGSIPDSVDRATTYSMSPANAVKFLNPA